MPYKPSSWVMEDFLSFTQGMHHDTTLVLRPNESGTNAEDPFCAGKKSRET